jgi:hypothetical protein
MLSLGSTYSELGGQDSDPSSWQASVRGHQLEWRETPQLYQHGVWDLLPVAVHQHGYRGRPTTGYALMDPLGAKVICQPRLLS